MSWLVGGARWIWEWAMVETTSYASPAGLGLIVIGDSAERYRSGEIFKDPWLLIDVGGIIPRVRPDLNSSCREVPQKQNLKNQSINNDSCTIYIL
jgi:hypothetical protein